MLEMKTECEKCSHALDPMSDAFVCSYECNFCPDRPDCTAAMGATCPNCSRELLARPQRKSLPAAN